MSTARPGPPTKPPRSAMTVRDMLFALLVLGAIALLVGGLSRSCAFAPGGPTVDGSQLPVVDAPAELARIAPGSGFAVRVPVLPPDWRANAVDRDVFEAGSAVRASWLTPTGRFLRLAQSTASEEALVAREAGSRPVAAQGVVDVDGRSWVAYQVGSGAQAEPLWTTDVDGVRLLITGSGDETALRALATAAVRATPLR